MKEKMMATTFIAFLRTCRALGASLLAGLLVIATNAATAATPPAAAGAFPMAINTNYAAITAPVVRPELTIPAMGTPVIPNPDQTLVFNQPIPHRPDIIALADARTTRTDAVVLADASGAKPSIPTIELTKYIQKTDDLIQRGNAIVARIKAIQDRGGDWKTNEVLLKDAINYVAFTSFYFAALKRQSALTINDEKVITDILQKISSGSGLKDRTIPLLRTYGAKSGDFLAVIQGALNDIGDPKCDDRCVTFSVDRINSAINDYLSMFPYKTLIITPKEQQMIEDFVKSVAGQGVNLRIK